MSFHWTCPYCDRDTTITDSYSVSYFDLRKKNAEGTLRFTTELIVCPNPKCQRFTLKIRKHQLQITSSGPDVVADPPSRALAWERFGIFGVHSAIYGSKNGSKFGRGEPFL
jgi:hypothetical protein